MMVKTQGWQYVESSKGLCTKLEQGMGFILLEASTEERTAFFADKDATRPGGTEQLIMSILQDGVTCCSALGALKGMLIDCSHFVGIGHVYCVRWVLL